MAIKKGGEERHDTARRQKRTSSPRQKTEIHQLSNNDCPKPSELLGVQLDVSQRYLPVKFTSNHKSNKVISNGKNVSHPSSNRTIQLPRKEQSSRNRDGEKPAPEQSQLHPLPLTKENT